VCVSVAGQRDSAAEEYLRVYSGLHKLVALTRSTVKDPTALSDLGELQQILEGGSRDEGPAHILQITWIQLLLHS